MKNDDGGPAFPCETQEKNGLMGYPDVTVTHGGMSLRDYFAGQALATMRHDPWSDNPLYWEGVARSAFVCADAMLKARGK